MIFRMPRKVLKAAKITAISIFAVGVTFFGVKPQPARADLASAIEQVNAVMTMLDGIAQTGVGIVAVPFGIGFALKIAGHVLRAGT